MIFFRQQYSILLENHRFGKPSRSVESIYNITERELLRPRTISSAIIFYALEIYRILKLGKKVLLQQNSSIYEAKFGHSSDEDTIFTN